MELLDIGEVSARTGFAPSALRYYEKEGLIESVERHGLRRQYSPDVLRALGVVAMCQRAGFKLTEIQALLETDGGPAWKELVRRKELELRAQAEHLATTADHLRHARKCPSPNVFDCPNFQAALEDALPVGS